MGKMITWDNIRSKDEQTIKEALGPLYDVHEIIRTLIDRRISLGLTQAKLARIAGLKQPAVARFESFSIVPRLDTLITISKALDLEITIEAKDKTSKTAKIATLPFRPKKTPSSLTSSSVLDVPKKAPTIYPISSGTPSRKCGGVVFSGRR